MAAAIVTVVRGPHSPGDRREIIVDFTPSTSYPANGEPMTASLFGLQQVDAVVPLGAPIGSAAVIPVFDRAHGTLRIYTCSTGAEVSGDASANLMTLLVLGL